MLVPRKFIQLGYEEVRLSLMVSLSKIVVVLWVLWGMPSLISIQHNVVLALK